MIIQSIEEDRKLDGNRSIADKIIKRLHDLEMTVDVNFGRWVWELLQNAKDSVVDEDRKVDIFLKLTDETVTFSHNGKHFSEQDIRGLINQISSKEIEEGEQKRLTGRFGTGFITTHLLSKIVDVEGIVETVNQKFFKFNFRLDRIGSTTHQLAPKIEDVWKDFHNSAQEVSPDSVNNYLTSFTYPLSEEKQKETARRGVEEFKNLIPYVIVFIPKIGSVEIVENEKVTSFTRKDVVINDFIIPITKNDDSGNSEIHIAYCGNDKAGVAVKLDSLANSVEDLNNVPKLFCDFPLIGTESFYFPVIVNSFYFNPRPERDSIWLKGSDKSEVKENQEILIEAIQLYQQLLNKIAEYGTKKLYYVAETKTPKVDEKYFDEKWYQVSVQKPLRDIIIKSPIVDTVLAGRRKILADDKSTVDFPLQKSKEQREIIWNLSNKFKHHFYLPEYESIHHWYNVLWDYTYKLDLEQIAEYISKLSSITKLEDNLNGDVYKFLNELYHLIIENKNEDYFIKYAIVPNKLGSFCQLYELKVTTRQPHLYYDEINDEQLIEILTLTGNPWNTILIHPKVSLGLTTSKLQKSDIARAITTGINNAKSKQDPNITKSIILLSEWFEKYPDEGKDLFADLYNNKASLFMNTIEDKESLYSIMKSKTPLSKLTELAKAYENDPEILSIIRKRQQDIQDQKDRNEIGEAVEMVLAGILREYNFEVKKVISGRDLVVSIEGSNFKYDIEVKSTRTGNFVGLTPTQARTATENSNYYSLCVVHKDSNFVDQTYVKEKAKFVVNIGELLTSKVEQMQFLENEKSAVLNKPEEITLTSETDLEYRFRVSSTVWDKGKSLSEFVSFLKEKSGIASS